MAEEEMRDLNGLLSDIRVLDLCDEQGMFCARMMGDLGAEVIMVEPPGGSMGRRIGPFYKDKADAEHSLFWFAYAMNKKSITLDIDRADGKSLLLELVRQSDVVVESFPLGYLEEKGLGWEVLHSLNPGLVLVSITPFGETGPYRDFKGSDLVHWALGGMLYLAGDPDRPPVRISFPQSYLQAGAQAAVGTMAALCVRDMTGEGQIVSVAVHDCIPPTASEAVAVWDALRFDVKRAGSMKGRLNVHGMIENRLVFPCADGYVLHTLPGGQMGLEPNSELLDLMVRDGMDVGPLKETGWPFLDYASVTPAQMTTIMEALTALMARHTVDELYQYVFERGANIMLVPVHSAKGICEDEQLQAREYWVQVEHGELGAEITYPGAWAKVEDGPPLNTWRRAPHIGEHNDEIYGQLLGYSKEELVRFKQVGAI